VSWVVDNGGLDSLTGKSKWSMGYSGVWSGSVGQWSVVAVTVSVTSVGGGVWVSKTRVEKGRVSVGQWSGGGWGGEDSTTLGAGLGFSDGGEVSGTGFYDFRGVLNWSWSNKEWGGLGDWAFWKSIRSNTETAFVSDVIDTDFSTFWVDVSV